MGVGSCLFPLVQGLQRGRCTYVYKLSILTFIFLDLASP